MGSFPDYNHITAYGFYLLILQELKHEFNMKTTSIVNLDEVVNYLYKTPVDGQYIIDDTLKDSINKYRSIYGEKN